MSKLPAVAELESLLHAKRLGITLLQPWAADARARLISTGLPTLDSALGGGWRQGEVSELVGPPTSGRTSALVATLSAATARGGMVALVDALDRFDPRAAAEAGCDLARVLWVRGPAVAAGASAGLLQRAVQQAVRACDLILRAKGFAVVALDVADVPLRQLRALPLATWMRLARANEGQPAVCLLLAPAPLGRSARGATVELSGAATWTGTTAQSRRLSGIAIDARVKGTGVRAHG